MATSNLPAEVQHQLATEEQLEEAFGLTAAAAPNLSAVEDLTVHSSTDVESNLCASCKTDCNGDEVMCALSSTH